MHCWSSITAWFSNDMSLTSAFNMQHRMHPVSMKKKELVLYAVGPKPLNYFNSGLINIYGPFEFLSRLPLKLREIYFELIGNAMKASLCNIIDQFIFRYIQ